MGRAFRQREQLMHQLEDAWFVPGSEEEEHESVIRDKTRKGRVTKDPKCHDKELELCAYMNNS